jgi:hypothetical protein
VVRSLRIFFSLLPYTNPANAQPFSGINPIISIVSASGCSFSFEDAACLCNNKDVVGKIRKELPRRCTNLQDLGQYETLFNRMCQPYPGFPVNLTQDALAMSNDAATNRARLGIWMVPLAAGAAALI